MESLHEASMNFDLANTEPFLIRCEANLKIGLDVDLLMYLVEVTELDMRSHAEINARYQGERIPVTFHVYRDDIESFTLHFHTQSKPLAEAINAEMLAFAEDHDL